LSFFLKAWVLLVVQMSIGRLFQAVGPADSPNFSDVHGTGKVLLSLGMCRYVHLWIEWCWAMHAFASDCRASLHFGQYSFCILKVGELAGYIPRWFAHPTLVTHANTNWAGCRVTSLTHPWPLLLHQTATIMWHIKLVCTMRVAHDGRRPNIVSLSVECCWANHANLTKMLLSIVCHCILTCLIMAFESCCQ